MLLTYEFTCLTKLVIHLRDGMNHVTVCIYFCALTFGIELTTSPKLLKLMLLRRSLILVRTKNKLLECYLKNQCYNGFTAMLLL